MDASPLSRLGGSGFRWVRLPMAPSFPWRHQASFAAALLLCRAAVGRGAYDTRFQLAMFQYSTSNGPAATFSSRNVVAMP